LGKKFFEKGLLIMLFGRRLSACLIVTIIFIVFIQVGSSPPMNAAAPSSALAEASDEGEDLRRTIYRKLPPSRTVADLEAADFFDNMDSGFLANVEKIGPGSFIFDIQDNQIYGYQGSLMVWFYGMCDLRNVKIASGEKLRLGVRGPTGLKRVRPVYSYDGVSWRHVPEGWGNDGKTFRFDVPLESGQTRVYFATHYPYTSVRALELALTRAKNRFVRSIEIIGRTERERPITMLTITDPGTPDRAKRSILLSAGDHPGETASLWGLEGSTDFLLSDDPAAQALRRKAVFYVVPILAVDGVALGTDRRQATGVNIYFDYQNFESREARVMWSLVSKLRPALWLDYHSWHLGVAEGLYGPHPKVIGEEKYAPVAELIKVIGKHFPINQHGPDTLDSPNTQAMLKLGVLGFCPEFNFGEGADKRWKTIDDQKALGVKIMLGVNDYLKPKR
jgi:zinc carboxypeptidase